MELEMLIHNPDLADEIAALNAIYIDHFIQATFSDDHHTTLSIRFPVFGFSFLVHVPSEYPSVSPTVVGVDDLVASTKTGVLQNAVYFGACIQAVYSQDEVCLFDAINEFETIYQSLRALEQQHDGEEEEGKGEELAERRAVRRAEILQNLALRARSRTNTGRSDFLKGDSPFEIIDCSSCLEPFFRVDTANLTCRHSLCPECLREGVLTMYKARSELRCCGQSVQLRTIRKHGNFDDEFLESYALWQQEVHAPNPTYCPWEDCLVYIPRRFVREDYAKCPLCKRRMCMGCKRKEHGGMCRQDKKFKLLVEKSGWKYCSCGQLVGRTHGCNHMTCICGQEFCYKCGEFYQDRRAQCDCGLFAPI